MLSVTPIVVILLFYIAFRLWLKYLTKGKEIKVIREEQLYNRNIENKFAKNTDQRDPVRREGRIEQREEEEEDRDSGIV